MEWPVEARLEPSNIQENICGCGILIDPDKKVNIFFTLNGILGELFLDVSRKFSLERQQKF
jgi:hypothetical protein